MEEESKKKENRDRVFFYAVIGIATLVIAIIGASFAYFGAVATDSDAISGDAAAAGLSLTVEHLSTDAIGGLIPLNTSELSKGLAGDPTTDSKQCIDKDGNSVCQVYSITVTNDSDATSVIKGDLDLEAVTPEEAEKSSAFENLKWELLTDATTLDDSATAYTTGTNPITTSESVAGGSSVTYYLIIWIENIVDAAQEDVDHGHFNGTVTFDAANGTGVAGTFSY